jgi:hypothetical protein
MNIEVTRQDAKKALQLFRKEGIKTVCFSKFADRYIARREIEILSNTLNSFDSDNYSIELKDTKVIIKHNTFIGSFFIDAEPQGKEIFFNHNFINNTTTNLKEMNIQEIFNGLQAARENKTMKSFSKETKEKFNIDLSVQGIRSAGHHEGQVYHKYTAFERYVNNTAPIKETRPEPVKKVEVAKVEVFNIDPAPTAPKVEKAPEPKEKAGANEVESFINIIKTFGTNENRVIELIKEHAPKGNDGPTTIINIPNAKEPKVLKGKQHYLFENIMILLSSGNNVMLTGPAGSGKTFTAMQAANALDLQFFAISLCVQTPMSALLGYMDAVGKFVETDFYRAFVNGGVFCFDELDNGNTNILSVLNSALSNGFCSFANGKQFAHADFRCVATANTIGTGANAKYIGRNAIDKATLDRFSMVYYDYDPAIEILMCDGQKDIYDMVLHARNILKDTNAVISPRATAAIYKMRNAGLPLKTAYEYAILNKLTDNEKQILCK